MIFGNTVANSQTPALKNLKFEGSLLFLELIISFLEYSQKRFRFHNLTCVYYFHVKLVIKNLTKKLVKVTNIGAITCDTFLTYFRPSLPHKSYRAFHRFGQAKFPDGGSIAHFLSNLLEKLLKYLT